MQINFRWEEVLATKAEKEEIEKRITEDLLSGHFTFTPPDDGIINVSLSPDEPRDFKILGVATDSNGGTLFRFSTSSMTASLSIAYDFSKALPASS